MGPFGMPIICWGLAKPAAAAAAAAGWKPAWAAMKVDGSIMAPAATALGSAICGKPLPLWFWTAASFIQELMAGTADGEGWRRGACSDPNPSGRGMPCDSVSDHENMGDVIERDAK